MPIFDQGYQHWQGTLSGHAWRWWTITRQGVRAGMKGWSTRRWLLVSLIPSLVLASFLVLWGLGEQTANQAILQAIPILPPAIREAPREFRVTFWTLAYQIFFNVQILFSMVVVAFVGPRLISQDLRFNAVPLYFSRPIRRFDYFAGKLGVIGVFIAGTAIVPPLFAYVLGIAFTADLSVIGDTIRIVGASVLYGLVVVVSAGTLMLAISSLTRNSRYVAMIWIGLWLVSWVMAAHLTSDLKQDWCPAVSYMGNLQRMGEVFLDYDTAQTRFSNAVNDARRRDMGRPFPPRRLGHGAPQPPSPPTAVEGQAGVAPIPKPPWYLSAGILAGLFGISLWTLTSRVKSLDRLR